VTIFNFANSAYDELHRLAWAGALLITLAVLALSILARLVESKRSIV
jgi:phosphate transport system permease protein